MNNKIDTLELANELKGLNTIVSIQNRLNINRARAIYLVHKLREKGYVKTKYQSNGIRVYRIYPENALRGTNYIDIINEYSPIKLARFDINQIYGRKLSIEETLIYAISEGTIRYVIASLSLFRKVVDWSLLYSLAKERGLVRQVAALYDIARLYLPKLKRMPKRFKTLATPKKTDRFLYIIEHYSSDNFKDIEKKWKVYIPLNAADLNEYKGVFT